MKRILKIILRALFIVLILFVGVVAFYTIKGYTVYVDALNKVSIEQKVKEIKSKKEYTKFEEVPKIYVRAVLAVEDHRFYEHRGIDLIAITRAIVNDIKAGKLVEGGSTITQQLAKNIYFTQERKIERKIAEMFMAFKLESKLDKNEILELYFNTSYYGDGYYTLKEASKGYFGKLPSEMTPYESTLLAGIPNAPSVYAPTKNPKLALQRQKQVISKMIAYGYISEEEGEEILKSLK